MTQAIVAITLFVSLLLLAGCINWNTEVYPATSAFPQIAVDSQDNVHIIWMDNRGRGEYLSSIWRIYYSKLDKDGKIVIDNKILTNPESSHIYRHNIWGGIDYQIKLGSQDKIYLTSKLGYMELDREKGIIVGEEKDFDNYVIMGPLDAKPDRYKEIVHGGYKMEELFQIEDAEIDTYNNFHLVWSYWAGEVYYKKLNEEGKLLVGDMIKNEGLKLEGHTGESKWTGFEAIKLKEDRSFVEGNPKIALDSHNNAYVAWRDSRDDKDQKHPLTAKIYYTKLDTTGNTLIDDTALNCKYYYSDVSEFVIKTDSANNLHIAWIADNSRIYYAKLDKDGQILNYCKKLNKYSGDKAHLDISMDSKNNIHIVWESKNNIYYMKRDSYGNTLIEETVISTADGFISSNPKIAIDSHNNIHVVWMDQKDYPNDKGSDPKMYSEGFYEIYYKKLDNRGNTIISDKRLTPINDNVLIQFD
ncbi:MAG: hypothetical protein V1672_04595 [Candidatus Diapherotrites archaeon]